MPPRKRAHSPAFSLVELSIVLVILGLLTGGILAGQSLIRAAELRSIISDYRKYVAATHTFKDRYFSLPGDLTNAITLWGRAGGTGSDSACGTTDSTGTETCNGDGDGTLVNSNGVIEYQRYWQHLANAGLVEGRYTGTSAATAPNFVPGVNVPLAKIGNAFFRAYSNTAPFVGTTTSFSADRGNFFLFSSTTASAAPGTFPLKPEEAWNIDQKIDDGLPGSGGIIALYKGDGTNFFCTTVGGVAPPADAGATYMLSNSNKDCGLLFLRAF